MNPNAESPYVDAKGAVAYLALPSLASLEWHIKENGLPVCRSFGRFRRFDKRELDAWVRGKSSALDFARETRARRKAS